MRNYCHKSALQLSIDANYRVYGGLSIVIYVHSDRGPFSGGPEDYSFIMTVAYNYLCSY